MNPTAGNDSIVKEIVISAPAERVFAALVDPQQRVAWWGAEGRFRAAQMESDLRPGGKWIMRGTGIGGKPFTIHGEYRTVDPPRAIEFTWVADWDDTGTSIVRFDLIEQNGATTVRLTHSGLATESSRERYQGWPWLLALLQAYVQKQATNT